MENLELDELVYTYPLYDEKGVQTLISAKEEFREVSGLTSEAPPKRGELFRHQKFIKRLMLQYDNQMLIHETGTGKGCSVLSVTEHYKRLAGALEDLRKTLSSPINNLKPPYKRAYILVKGQTLIDEMKFQLLCKCTDGDYITEQILNSKTETARKGNVTRSLSKFYTFDTYGVFAKKLFKMTDEQLKIEFNNCIFIVDEIHNITDKTGGFKRVEPTTGNEYYVKIKKDKQTGIDKEKIDTSRLIYDQLWRLFHTVSPRKVMLMSATPMINDPSEIGPRLNLILPKDNQIPKLNYRTATLETLEPYFRGLISYVRALDTGAIPVYQGEVIKASYEMITDEEGDVQRLKRIKSGNSDTKSGQRIQAQMVVYQSKMSKKQSDVYYLATQDPMALKPDSDKPEAFSDLERQTANFVFPDNTTGSAGYHKYVKESGNNFIATPELLNWIYDPNKLRQLSSKFYEIVRLSKSRPGNCWCYSDFIRGSGAIVLGLCFEAQGFKRFDRSSSIFSSTGGSGTNICQAKSLDDLDIKKERTINISKELRYALLTSETSGPEAAALLEAFNSYENRHGEYIKAVIGSPVSRDGLNLANVLQIHLTGSGWNQASIYQAESRAIRSTSHVDLIEEERERLRRLGADEETIANVKVTIDIYRHAAIDESGSSIDLQMYQLSEIKDREIKRIMRMMKQSSIDCQINYNRNVRLTDINNTATCDYQLCKYKCVDPEPDYIDYTSFDVLYSDGIIEAAKGEIIDIFRVVFTIPYLILYSELSGYRKKFIDLAVSDLIEKKIPITDRYGYLSYLREDRGTLFLTRDYPLNIFENPGAVANAEYTSTLLGISKISLNEYNGYLQIAGQENILDLLKGVDPLSVQFNEIISNLTLENKILLLESAIYNYYILKTETPEIIGVIDKFRQFIYLLREPLESIKIASKALAGRGQGRGRKAREGSKFRLTADQEANIEKAFTKKVGPDVIYLHNLSTAGPSLTAYAITAKSRKSEGKIRLLNESEAIGWRDANEVEDLVYNTYIKSKLQETSEELAELEIYGTILEDGKFRIVDKTTEDPNLATRDARKINRGRICSNGWKKPELYELMWKLRFNPFKIDLDIDRNRLIEYVLSQNLADRESVNNFSDEKLKLYYSWGTSGSNRQRICEFLENHLDEIGKLIKT